MAQKTRHNGGRGDQEIPQGRRWPRAVAPEQMGSREGEGRPQLRETAAVGDLGECCPQRRGERWRGAGCCACKWMVAENGHRRAACEVETIATVEGGTRGQSVMERAVLELRKKCKHTSFRLAD